jgi:hypothetical protein
MVDCFPITLTAGSLMRIIHRLADIQAESVVFFPKRVILPSAHPDITAGSVYW